MKLFGVTRDTMEGKLRFAWNIRPDSRLISHDPIRSHLPPPPPFASPFPLTSPLLSSLLPSSVFQLHSVLPPSSVHQLPSLSFKLPKPIMPNPPLARTLKSIQNLVDQQEWYAAHQKYRTSAARLLKSSEPTAIQDVISLLFEGSRLLLERGQPGSGTDLGLMLIRDVYVARKVKYTVEERNKLLNLIALAGPLNNWRKTLVDAAVAWSCEAGECPTGDPVLHLAVGERLFKENQLQSATVHLLSACNRDAAKVLSNVMWTWAKEDKSKADGSILGRYAAMGVLGYLELGSIVAARTFLDDFLAKTAAAYPRLLNSTMPSPINNSTIQVFIVPSLNFLQLLILSCQVGTGTQPNGSAPPPNYTGATIGKAVYQAMIGRYSRLEGWATSPAIKETFTTLGEMYFGIRQQRQGANILNDLMGSLFSGPPSLPPSARGGGKADGSRGISAPGLD